MMGGAVSSSTNSFNSILNPDFFLTTFVFQSGKVGAEEGAASGFFFANSAFCLTFFDFFLGFLTCEVSKVSDSSSEAFLAGSLTTVMPDPEAGNVLFVLRLVMVTPSAAAASVTSAPSALSPTSASPPVSSRSSAEMAAAEAGTETEAGAEEWSTG